MTKYKDKQVLIKVYSDWHKHFDACNYGIVGTL